MRIARRSKSRITYMWLCGLWMLLAFTAGCNQSNEKVVIPVKRDGVSAKQHPLARSRQGNPVLREKLKRSSRRSSCN